MLEAIKSITYRGSLKSCNYSCSYCPFCKKKMSSEELQYDKEALERFCSKIEACNFKEPVQILFAPYGEALIQPYYRKAMAELSKKDFVKGVGCQTNLSIPIDDWLNDMLDQKADFSKVVLWATFHPEMITAEVFAQHVNTLVPYIDICVGAVGNPMCSGQIKELREKLLPKIYMWINKMDGLKEKYREEELELYQSIDPMFHWELEIGGTPPCEGGAGHLFITSNGNLYACNRNTVKLGNLYNGNEEIWVQPCTGKRCDCYLAYSHLHSFAQSGLLKGNGLYRIPKRIAPEALFLDVDGTLLGKDGRIHSDTKRALAYISQKLPIYLATELPFVIAMRKCREIRHLLSGGCFAGGGHCIEWKKGYEEYSYLPEGIDANWKNANTSIHEGKAYRMLIPKAVLEEKKPLLMDMDIDCVSQVSGRVSLVRKGVDKRSGIEKLCAWLGISVDSSMVVGNSERDKSMLESAGYGVAVPESTGSLKKMADYILGVHQLGYIL